MEFLKISDEFPTQPPFGPLWVKTTQPSSASPNGFQNEGSQIYGVHRIFIHKTEKNMGGRTGNVTLTDKEEDYANIQKDPTADFQGDYKKIWTTQILIDWFEDCNELGEWIEPLGTGVLKGTRKKGRQKS